MFQIAGGFYQRVIGEAIVSTEMPHRPVGIKTGAVLVTLTRRYRVLVLTLSLTFTWWNIQPAKQVQA